MPYVKIDRRKEIDPLIDFNKASDVQLSVGDLNYLITSLLLTQLKTVSYTKVNDLIGVLECAKLEVYNRLAVYYEAEKERENSDVYPVQASAINLAWAGGFFEGEGCFYTHKGKPRFNGTALMTASASLVQKGLQGKVLLEQFQNVTKLGFIYHQKKGDMYIWKISKNEEVEILFNLLRPYLGERRQKKYLEIKHKVQTQGKHKRTLKSKCKKGHLYSEVGQQKDNTCKLCNSIYQKAWYHKHKGKKYE